MKVGECPSESLSCPQRCRPHQSVTRYSDKLRWAVLEPLWPHNSAGLEYFRASLVPFFCSLAWEL